MHRLRELGGRLRRRYQGLFGGTVLLLLILTAALAPWIAPYDPDRIDIPNRLTPPSREHWLGTDHQGRDVLSRLIWGSRVSLLAGVLATAISASAGTVLGLVSGYFGGRVDLVVQRVVDAFLAFPGLVLMIAFAAMFGPGLKNALIAIGISGTPGFTRLVRGQVLAVRAREFIEASRATGATHMRVMFRHILPNVLPPIIVWASLGIAGGILGEAGLSYLGLGVQPPTASWGSMVNQGNQYLRQAPWIALVPGSAIFVVVLGTNLFGDALRDAWDPRLRGSR